MRQKTCYLFSLSSRISSNISLWTANQNEYYESFHYKCFYRRGWNLPSNTFTTDRTVTGVQGCMETCHQLLWDLERLSSGIQQILVRVLRFTSNLFNLLSHAKNRKEQNVKQQDCPLEFRTHLPTSIILRRRWMTTASKRI